jgi:glycosyltransferase involved in cell wall biosynthesis
MTNTSQCQEPPSKNSTPSVSIVIVAYKRRDYLLRAMKSAIGQIGTKGPYEVVVVKNLKDEEIDEYIRQNGIRSIEMPSGPVGEYIARGIQASSADVVCLLDDDDAFLPEKVTQVQRAFSLDHKLCYYHSAHEIRYDDDTVVRSVLHRPALISTSVSGESSDYRTLKRIIANNLVLNLSCVSVRRSVFLNWIEAIRGMQGATDFMMFYVALATKGNLLFDRAIQSIYYIHRNSASRPVDHSMSSIDPVQRWAHEQMYTYTFGVSLPESIGILEAASALKSQWEWIYLLMSSVNRREIVPSYGKFVSSSLLLRPGFVVLSIPIGLVSLASPTFGRRLFHLLRTVNLNL